MGDDIDCCRRPTNFGKKDIKTYRGIKPKNNPNIPSLNSKDFDNFGSFKKTNNLNKNLNKKGNSYFNSVYDNDSKFPNFSEFDIEPVSEPLNNEQISQPQNQYINNNPQTQYVDSNQVINQQNQIIQDTNYINSNNQYSSPQIQNENVQYLQPEYTTNNYGQTVETNYISKNTQDYMSAINISSNSKPVEYINSSNNENIINQYGNEQTILPTKYIQIEKPVIYSTNNNNQYQSIKEYTQTPVTNYVESSSTNQIYEHYNFNNTNTSPQYYDSKSNVTFLPSNNENVYTTQNQYVEEITNPQFNQIQNANYPQQNSYISNPQQIYIEQNPSNIYMDNKYEIENQVYAQKLNNNNENKLNRTKKNHHHKKSKKLKKKRKIIEYYSEDDDEEEEEEEDEEENEQSSSQNEEIEEQKPKKKKVSKKNKNKFKNKKENIKTKKKSKNNQKQNLKSTEDKENESDNIDYEYDNNKIRDQNLKRIQLKKDEEEFSGFQKEPEIQESFGDIINNSGEVFEYNNKEDIKFKNKKDEKQILSLKNGSKIIGNFKKEEILENRNEKAQKEREELFQGKTLKVASVEKKEETAGCQVPGFLSNIFSKIF